MTVQISIHAPRAGRDHSWVNIQLNLEISIHAPRAGARPNNYIAIRPTLLFQSTRPVRGRDALSAFRGRDVNISIHAPRAGARQLSSLCDNLSYNFNPRAPCGGATKF